MNYYGRGMETGDENMAHSYGKRSTRNIDHRRNYNNVEHCYGRGMTFSNEQYSQILHMLGKSNLQEGKEIATSATHTNNAGSSSQVPSINTSAADWRLFPSAFPEVEDEHKPSVVSTEVTSSSPTDLPVVISSSESPIVPNTIPTSVVHIQRRSHRSSKTPIWMKCICCSV
ncbi:hypothetical protein HAX54_009451 [Datura stramonium]|uniref:Uncharacterized protein n=1 Tax=Datura stramonium TaxID=4076 RepID=A0ABS8TER7_DATST|nr:hypothetical protein [Datura stramonium]